MSVFETFRARVATAGYAAYDSTAENPDGVPFSPPYYVVDGGNITRLGDERLAAWLGAQADQELAFTVLSVASTADGARIMSRLAFGVLVGWQMPITGRTGGAVRFDVEEPAVPDDAISPVVYVATARYLVASNR